MSVLNLYDVILSPLISEKSTMIGEKSNQFVFKVSKSATKHQIKKAVELFFKVKVESVRVSNIKGKQKRYGRQIGKRKNEKKAYISLAEGEEITLGTGD
mgnify:CR=1 FL=1